MTATGHISEKLSALFIQAMTGDKIAYERFLRETTFWLRRIIARRIPPSDVEDVVQEIILSIHKARHTYDGKRPLIPWLMAITRFRISDYLRKYYAQHRQQTVDISELADILCDVTQTPASAESLSELLCHVPERERQILTLMHVEGFTAKEVGGKLNMKESAVKVAAHRAVKKIRAVFNV